MAGPAAIAAVSRTLRTLLLDQMEAPVEVTLAPPDVQVAGVTKRHVNLYLMEVLEHPTLANDEIPGEGNPASYGRPPLSLNLRYLMTTHSQDEDHIDSDLNAQTLLGDAMRVMHEFGNQLHSLKITKASAGAVGDILLDMDLRNEYEKLKLRLHPAKLDEITKVWSAVSGTNFRRSVIYEVTVIQIESKLPRKVAKPVEKRRIMASVKRRPEILDAYVVPVPASLVTSLKQAQIGDTIAINAMGLTADKLYVKIGTLQPIRIPPQADGVIQIALPDAQYPIDLDHVAPRPIPSHEMLQPGPLDIRLIANDPVDGVEGGLDAGKALVGVARNLESNSAVLQLVPTQVALNPGAGPISTKLVVQGKRLWHASARGVQIIVGDAAIPVMGPGSANPPSATSVTADLSSADSLIPTVGQTYTVQVLVDGALSRGPVLGFKRT